MTLYFGIPVHYKKFAWIYFSQITIVLFVIINKTGNSLFLLFSFSAEMECSQSHTLMTLLPTKRTDACLLASSLSARNASISSLCCYQSFLGRTFLCPRITLFSETSPRQWWALFWHPVNSFCFFLVKMMWLWSNFSVKILICGSIDLKAVPLFWCQAYNCSYLKSI